MILLRTVKAQVFEDFPFLVCHRRIVFELVLVTAVEAAQALT